jgi:hypothetical protein
MRAGAARAAELSVGTAGACVLVYTADDALLLRTIVDAVRAADCSLHVVALLPRAALARVAESSWLPKSVTLIGVRGPHEVAASIAESLPAGLIVTAALIEP